MTIDWLLLVLLGFGCLIGYSLWTVAYPPWPINIIVTKKGVVSAEGLPEARRRRILEFLERDLAVEAKVTIYALRGTGGRLRTKVNGPVDLGTKQRIRNYLLSEL